MNSLRTRYGKRFVSPENNITELHCGNIFILWIDDKVSYDRIVFWNNIIELYHGITARSEITDLGLRNDITE